VACVFGGEDVVAGDDEDVAGFAGEDDPAGVGEDVAHAGTAEATVQGGNFGEIFRDSEPAFEGGTADEEDAAGFGRVGLA